MKKMMNWTETVGGSFLSLMDKSLVIQSSYEKEIKCFLHSVKSFKII